MLSAASQSVSGEAGRRNRGQDEGDLWISYTFPTEGSTFGAANRHISFSFSFFPFSFFLVRCSKRVRRGGNSASARAGGFSRSTWGEGMAETLFLLFWLRDRACHTGGTKAGLAEGGTERIDEIN